MNKGAGEAPVKPRKPRAPRKPRVPNPVSFPRDMVIFALDPSLAASGWALVKYADGLITLIGCGEVPTNPKQTHGERLRVIREALQGVAKGEQITDVVKERGFSRFPAATQALYKTHGILEEMFAEFKVVEYAVTTVKLSVGGSGKSSKEEVAAGTKRMLGLPEDYEFISDNASDAVAAALTHIIKNKVLWGNL